MWEQVDLRRRTRHVQVDDRLRLGGDAEAGVSARGGALAPEQLVQGHGAEAEPGAAEEVPASLRLKFLSEGGHGFIKVSSRLSNTLATATIAASPSSSRADLSKSLAASGSASKSALSAS